MGRLSAVEEEENAVHRGVDAVARHTAVGVECGLGARGELRPFVALHELLEVERVEQRPDVSAHRAAREVGADSAAAGEQTVRRAEVHRPRTAAQARAEIDAAQVVGGDAEAPERSFRPDGCAAGERVEAAPGGHDVGREAVQAASLHDAPQRQRPGIDAGGVGLASCVVVAVDPCAAAAHADDGIGGIARGGEREASRGRHAGGQVNAAAAANADGLLDI